MDGQRFIQIEAPQPGLPLTCRLLTVPLEFDMHFLPDRRGDFPCFYEQCRYCPDRRRVKGYAAAIRKPRQNEYGIACSDGNKRTLMVLELTQSVLDDLAGQADAGLVIRLDRGKDRNSRVRVKVLEVALEYDLPAPFDVRPIIMRRWGISALPVKPQQQPGPDNILKFRRQA